MINWTNDKNTMELQSKIADRAIKMARTIGIKIDKITMVMDIDACHSNGCPLKLEELLKADDYNFGHDVFGIRRHMNRETGKLENCFLPRYSK
jgi:hypothetical protein